MDVRMPASACNASKTQSTIRVDLSAIVASRNIQTVLMTVRNCGGTRSGAPHPRPLSREGRGEKDSAKQRHLRRKTIFVTLLRSPLAGEGLGVAGGEGYPATVRESRTVI
jgi:hypothetical protein